MALTMTNKQVRPLNGAVVRSYVLGGTASLGDWVYVDTNGKVQAGLADASETAEVIGLIVSGADEVTNKTGNFAAGQTVGVCVFGMVTGFSGMTAGTDVYLSAATAGGSAEAAPANPNYTKVCARVVTPTQLFVNALQTPLNVQTAA
jgi:hypothetical protein